jgi:hypothetical protein
LLEVPSGIGKALQEITEVHGHLNHWYGEDVAVVITRRQLVLSTPADLRHRLLPPRLGAGFTPKLHTLPHPHAGLGTLS